MEDFMRYGSWASFWEQFPVLGVRLHTLHNETNSCGGVHQEFDYIGTERDGHGFMTIHTYYGTVRCYKFTVTKGKLKAFGRTQNMRKPTTMILSDGTRIKDGYMPEPMLED